jgi:hypothetical protein
MTLEITGCTNFRGFRRPLTAFVALLMPVAPGCAQTVRETRTFARRYSETKHPFFAPKSFPVSTAVSVFPGEIHAALKSWTLRCVGAAGACRHGATCGLSVTASAELRGNS